MIEDWYLIIRIQRSLIYLLSY